MNCCILLFWYSVMVCFGYGIIAYRIHTKSEPVFCGGEMYFSPSLSLILPLSLSVSLCVCVCVCVCVCGVCLCVCVCVCVGFDLCEVGQEEVVLKTGKQASRRILHFALQALLALFGKTHTHKFVYIHLVYIYIYIDTQTLSHHALTHRLLGENSPTHTQCLRKVFRPFFHILLCFRLSLKSFISHQYTHNTSL